MSISRAEVIKRIGRLVARVNQIISRESEGMRLFLQVRLAGVFVLASHADWWMDAGQLDPEQLNELVERIEIFIDRREIELEERRKEGKSMDTPGHDTKTPMQMLGEISDLATRACGMCAAMEDLNFDVRETFERTAHEAIFLVDGVKALVRLEVHSEAEFEAYRAQLDAAIKQCEAQTERNINILRRIRGV